jgi:hypothetical protein
MLNPFLVPSEPEMNGYSGEGYYADSAGKMNAG